ncbi:hypothetical protein NE237_012430 [Protea cynaroides]|uniref:Uncharacterized protein n=1 Tax=Protea cynaroides TaxID=273540 RepID=A0A9Q0H112_9MAGN|nr:hypothetical protein NE237_012430 [Protea cynaroides]
MRPLHVNPRSCSRIWRCIRTPQRGVAFNVLNLSVDIGVMAQPVPFGYSRLSGHGGGHTVFLLCSVLPSRFFYQERSWPVTLKGFERRPHHGSWPCWRNNPNRENGPFWGRQGVIRYVIDWMMEKPANSKRGNVKSSSEFRFQSEASCASLFSFPAARRATTNVVSLRAILK